MAYWLMKSEPDVYGIDDLKKARRDCWDGVRNYQARSSILNSPGSDLNSQYFTSLLVVVDTRRTSSVDTTFRHDRVQWHVPVLSLQM